MSSNMLFKKRLFLDFSSCRIFIVNPYSSIWSQKYVILLVGSGKNLITSDLFFEFIESQTKIKIPKGIIPKIQEKKEDPTTTPRPKIKSTTKPINKTMSKNYKIN